MRRSRKHDPERAKRSVYGWWNWYVNRERLPLPVTAKALRAISWRRVH